MPEDRDQLFEKALARQLRAGAADNASACLDAETLAAYHERLLSAEEMMAVKDHLVGCARCQQILAQLELTHDLVEKEEQRAVPVAALTAAPAQSKSKVAEIPMKKSATLRWAAPLGAIAAVLLLWVGLRQSRMHEAASSAPVQIADNRNQPAPAQPALPPATLQDESREKASSNASSDEKTLSRYNDSLGVAPRTALPTEPSGKGTRADSLQKDDRGFGSGAGNGPVLKSKQAELSAAPALDAADSAKPGDAISGAVGGAMAKKAVAPAPSKPSYKAETESQERDKIAYSAGQPPAAAGQAGAAATASASNALVPAPPPPPAPAPARGPSQLRGTVTDPSGAVVSRAQVALQSENGATVAQTSTDNGGTYTFNGVVAGNYQLQLQSPGFKTDTITGLNVAPGDNVQNAQLQIGASAETVEVAAQAPQLQTSAASPASIQNRQVSSLSSIGRDETQLRTLGLADASMLPFVAAAPGGKNQWRFGDLGIIFHSTDAGSSWHSQISGVTTKLTVGSATSDKVCWLAGANGTLLRTADGGKHWRRITVPITGDLGGVRATDAKHATIWDAPNQLRFETSDGGSSWQPASNQ